MPQGYAEEGQEKGKKKKWWGELFKRRARKVSDSSSDEEEEGKKKGFLSRRKKHDRGSKDVTNSFLINPGIKDVRGRSLDSVRSTGTQAGKKRIKAKVEASREQLAKDSSSDEGSSYTSSLPSGGSFPRRSRAARTERHNRRLWSASVVYQESNDYDTKYRAKTRSATPSPAASPKVRQRASSHDAVVVPPPPPRRMEAQKYYPPVYTAPTQHRSKPRYNGLTHHSSDPVIPRDWADQDSDLDRLHPVVEEKKPPAPPRRLPSVEDKRRQANLEEALNELEAIYKKLEDLQDPQDPDAEPLVTDDMAYRRLNKRQPSCQDVRELMSQAGSYLLVSPTLSPPPITPQSPTGEEPDITYDDVVYRSINHTNNTLKIVDPQPPFGIPLGPISPASNSDYLHAKPTFESNPPNTPDIVRDDLAFRNLRKDSQELRKKKAVRSLSANLSHVILKNNNNFNALNNNNIEGKSHSYSDIPEEMRLAQRVLDMRRMKKSANKRPQVQKINNEELRRRFFSDTYSPSETDLLKELEDEARATSLELEQQLSKSKTDALYSRSMADLLKELTKNLDSDFGQEATAAPCLTCGTQDTSKQMGRDSANNNCYKLNEASTKYISSRPKLMKEQALSSIDSPDPRKRLHHSFQSVPQYKPPSPSFRERPKPSSSPSSKETKNQLTRGYPPLESYMLIKKSQSLKYNSSCENLPRTPRRVESPRHWEGQRRDSSPKPVPIDAYGNMLKVDPLEETWKNLSEKVKAESPRLKDRSNYWHHPELHSSSMKVKSEIARPWETFKGRSESYHGPIPHRASPNWESSPNAFRRQQASSPRASYKEGSSPRYNNEGARSPRFTKEGSPRFNEGNPRCNNEGSPRYNNEGSPRYNNEGSPRYNREGSPRYNREESPRYNREEGQRFKEGSPRNWEKSLEEMKENLQSSQSFRSLSPRQLTPQPNETNYRLSPQHYKPQSPKPWLLNGNENLQRESFIRRDRSQSPKPWQPNLCGARSLDEHTFVPPERLSPRPRWSSLKDRTIQETYIGPNHEDHHHMKPWQTGFTGPRTMDECFVPQERLSPKQRWCPVKDRALEQNVGYLRESQIDASKWPKITSNKLSENQQPYFSVEFRKETPRNRWHSEKEFRHNESQAIPQKKIKHPAPWRHSLDAEGKMAKSRMSKSPDKMRSESQRNSLIECLDSVLKAEEPISPRPWEELNEICQKMQSESYEYKISKSITPEIKSDSPSCWEPKDIGGSEIRSEEEKVEDPQRLGATWRPESTDSATVNTSPDSPRLHRRSPSFSKKEFPTQLGAIGENRIRREPSPKRSSPRESLVERTQQKEERAPTLLNANPIDVAAMEAESEEDDKQGQGVSPKPATPVNTTENVQ